MLSTSFRRPSISTIPGGQGQDLSPSSPSSSICLGISNRAICLLSTCAIVVMIFLVRVFVFHPHSRPSFSPYPDTHESSVTVLTDEYKEAVELLKNSMDKSFSPCEDFYQFACGGWNNKQSIKLKEKGSINITTTTELSAMDESNVQLITKLIERLPLPNPNLPTRTLPDMIKRFYNSCIETKNLLFILDILVKLANSTASQEPDANAKNHNRLEPIAGIIGKEEIQEWEYILKKLHPNPEKELPEFLKLSFDSDEEDDTQTRTTICTYFVQELLPEGVAKLFITSHYLNDPLTDSKINALIANIWDTFRTMTLYSAPWIEPWDTKSRLNMSQSIRGMSVVSGYVADIMNSTGMEGHYVNVTITDHFLHNLRELLDLRDERKTEGDVMDIFNLRFYKETTKANAFYTQILDTIFIPAGIVQVPKFHHSFPEILKYAKIGTTVAHEFAHSLDPYIEGITLEGPPFNTSIKISDSVVSVVTRENFKLRSNCVVSQYDEMDVKIGKFGHILRPTRVNGTLTVRENIADIAGMQIAFKSFLENAGSSFKPIPGLSEEWTKEQIFFIGAAQGKCQAYLDEAAEEKFLRDQVLTDVHSPNSIRVLGALANFDEFAKAFSCPKGSEYNPVKKCKFFNS